MSDSSPFVADRIQRLHGSALRNIFTAIQQDKLISFAGGLPSEDTFPDLQGLLSSPAHYQYGPSEGELALRELIAQELTNSGLATCAERVIVLSGSQQGIDLVAKLLVQEGTLVAIESPTYLAALQVFQLFGARFTGFTPGDASPAFSQQRPDMLYTVPTFQNPSGFNYNDAQRTALASLCDSHGTVLFEDDPYRELVYDDCDRTPVCASLTRADWVYQSSFSKTIAPGLRIGYLTCSESLYSHLLHLKQAADLHSCRLSQHVLLNLLEDEQRPGHHQRNLDTYRAKRDVFDQLLSKHFSDIADWDTPKGGLFFWLRFKPHVALNTTRLFEKAMTKGVAVMPSAFFYAHDARHNALRMNFSHASSQDAEKGLQRLAELVHEELI